MNETNSNFKEKLDELCESNFKVKAIMKANNNDFSQLPEFQKEMFLKFMENPKPIKEELEKKEDDSKKKIEEFEEFIEEKCDEFSQKLREECDGSYVGAEMEGDITFNSKKYSLQVIAFWEKASWCEYVLKENGVEIKSGSFY